MTFYTIMHPLQAWRGYKCVRERLLEIRAMTLR